MIELRRSDERGLADHGWLKSFHTFSFGDYRDSRFMGYRELRVINEDRVEPEKGFGTHAHQNMEILSYVIEGKLQHKDSMGNGSVILPGEVQYMSAGKGVTHSEFNPDFEEKVHFLQIWILPNQKDGAPRYDQKSFSKNLDSGALTLLASPNGESESIAIHQDAKLFGVRVASNKSVELPLGQRRYGWLQVVRGDGMLQEHKVKAGDGASISSETNLTFVAGADGCEILWFDLP